MNELLAEFLETEKAKGARKQNLIGLKKRVPCLLHYLSERDISLGALKMRGALAYQGSPGKA
jgi:hypothetical protein